MGTEIDKMKRIPIEEFLARLGHHPMQRKANALWYKAPYREERTASFKVNMEKNLWFDYGLGKGGNIFALAGEFIRCDDFFSQVKYVGEVAGMPLLTNGNYVPHTKVQSSGASYKDVEILPLQNYPLLSYLQGRGISAEVAKEHCKEIRYSINGKRYFAVAFGNESNGYEMRNKFYKGCLSPKDVSFISSGSVTCNVYEGFMDFLSARKLGIGKEEDHLVLNSVSNVSRAFPYLDGYGQINCYLDNDEAGKRTLETLWVRYGEKVMDHSGLYSRSKDLNSYLQALLAEEQGKKKNKSIKFKM